MITTRARMLGYLDGAEFPLHKVSLIHIAENNGAPEYILCILDEVQDMTYRDFAELMEEIDIVEPQVVV